MAPKATKAQIGAKLNELRQFLRENQEMLTARRGTALVKSLRQNQSADELKWYKFLNKRATAFDEEQAEHLKHTFALIGTVSNVSTAGVHHPAARKQRP